MSGGEINCGSFSGEDKSGSSFEAVLESIRSSVPSVWENVSEQLNDSEYVLISTVEALEILPHLENLVKKLEAEIGHGDWHLEYEREVSQGVDPVNGKYGKSRGWLLYCATNLLNACRVSLEENEPICVSFS